MMDIDKLTKHYEQLWNNCSAQFPHLQNQYSSDQQYINESNFEAIIQSLKTRSNRKKINGFLNDENEATSSELFRRLFVSIFGFEDAHLDHILSNDFKIATKSFIKEARGFDDLLDLDDIFQACRNAWIMLGLQVMLGVKVKLTPSIFSYSMLYPYTDNFIDDPNNSKEEKYSFSVRFYHRLSGQLIEPKNHTEKKVFELIEKIEGEYDRAKYPSVYKSLLAIHDAQTKSVSLVDKRDTLSDAEILKLCIDKGGTSVLADGFLVAGNLTKEQQISLFGYGTYLQFIDDIQDVKEDSDVGQMTVFAKEATKSKLDELTNKTFCLGRYVLGTMSCFSGPNIGEFQKLIEKSIDSMLIETILLNKDYYSANYIEKLSNYSPLSIEYLFKRRSKLSAQRISYIKNIAESAIANF